MPWKDRYTISDERSLADGDIKWPGGARLAVHVTLNLSPACGSSGIEPTDLRTPEAHYGLHGALDTLLFNKKGIAPQDIQDICEITESE